MSEYLYLIAGTEGMLLLSALLVLLIVFKQHSSFKHINALQKIQIEHGKKMIMAMLEGTENERKRIASELHDDVGQSLLLLRLQLISNRPSNTEIADVDRILDSVRSISHGLYPSGLSHFGISNELSELFDRVEKLGVNIEFSLSPKQIDLSSNIQLHMFRIIQELLANSIKHGKASNIKLEINSDSETIHIRYEDDGQGLPEDNVRNGIGMLNIESRLNIMNGLFRIPAVAQGFKFEAHLPQVS